MKTYDDPYLQKAGRKLGFRRSNHPPRGPCLELVRQLASGSVELLILALNDADSCGAARKQPRWLTEFDAVDIADASDAALAIATR